ncbi:MAG: hypothetical protein RL292_293 [Candidatus Parcubacteria bacterium]
MTVSIGGEVSLTVPERLWGRLGEAFAHQMLQSRAGWILAKIEHFRTLEEKVGKGRIQAQKLTKKQEREQYLAYKEKARVLTTERLEHFNSFYRFKIGRISIKNTKTRWGSCSRKGNLNFNYKIALLPAHHADYIIVHELCHLGQFNHSKKFWALVEETIPDYLKIHTELKKHHMHFS